mmetsp:Transcript_2104/g.5210  ORF Transcript_2104/g.5210 Transcript_2104/m.5210 type:complete len:935 (+) Transcript_2104:1865-4669(+)
MQRLTDIINRALTDTSSDFTAEFAQSARSATNQQCRDAISLIKKTIKNRKMLASQKLTALKLLHAGMMTANTNYLLFASKKISRRFMIMARHNKDSKSENRGLDLFNAQTSDQAAASAEFLKCLLTYIKLWARSFGIGPDKNPSDFYKLYNTLYREGVAFPSSSSLPAKPEPRPQQQAESKPERPAPPVERQSIPAGKPKSSDMDQAKNTVQLLTEMLRSGEASPDILTELVSELKLLKISIENEIQEAVNSGSTARITALIEANDNIQAGFDRFELYKKRPQSREKPQSKPKPEPADILGLDDQSPPIAGGSEFSAAMFNTYAPNSRQSMPVPPAFDTSRQSVVASSNYATLPTQPKNEPKPKPSPSEFDFSSAFSSEFSSPRQSLSNSIDPRMSLSNFEFSADVSSQLAQSAPPSASSPLAFEVESKEKAVAVLKLNLQESKQRFEALKAEHQNCGQSQKQIEKLKIERAERLRKVAEAEKTLATYQEQEGKLLASYRAAEAEVAEVEKLTNDLAAKLNEKTTQLKEYDSYLKQHETRLASLQQELDNQHATRTKLDSDLKLALQQQSEAEDKLDRLTNSLRQKKEQEFLKEPPKPEPVVEPAQQPPPIVERKAFKPEMSPVKEPYSTSHHRSSSSYSNSSDSVDDFAADAASSNPYLVPELSASIDVKANSMNFFFQAPPVPQKVSLETASPVNLHFCRLCNLYPQGVVYDDDKVQIGIQVMVQGTQGRAMLFIGNKSPDPISNIEIESWSPPELDLSITQPFDEASYASGQQTNRMANFEIKGFFGRPPKISVSFIRSGANESLLLQLPISVGRFVIPLKKTGAEIWQQWQNFSTNEVTLSFSSLSPDIKSMRELAMFICVGGATQLYLTNEVPELSPRSLLTAGVSPGGEVYCMVEVDASATQGTISVRSVDKGLRSALANLLVWLVQG